MKLDLILENIKNKYELGLLEESDNISEKDIIRGKILLNESTMSIRKKLITEGLLQYTKDLLQENWGRKVATGLGVAGAGMAGKNMYDIHKQGKQITNNTDGITNNANGISDNANGISDNANGVLNNATGISDNNKILHDSGAEGAAIVNNAVGKMTGHVADKANEYINNTGNLLTKLYNNSTDQ